MSPVVIGSGLFLVLELLHHFNAMLSFGFAGGMLLAGLLILWSGVLDGPQTPKNPRS